METTPSPIADLLERLDRENRYQFEERAGSIEFDAGIPRDDAECYALVDLLRAHPDALLAMSVLQLNKNAETAFVLTTDLRLAMAQFEGEGVEALWLPNLANVIKTLFDGIAVLSRTE